MDVNRYTAFSRLCEATMQSSRNQIAAKLNELKEKNKATEKDINDIVDGIYKEFKSKIEVLFTNTFQGEANLLKIKELSIKSAERNFNQLRNKNLESLSNRSETSFT